MADDCRSAKSTELEALARQAGQRRVLLVVLAINAAMFVAGFGAGVVAGSTALMELLYAPSDAGRGASAPLGFLA
jgi:Co/Zn/Cd efflux system component